MSVLEPPGDKGLTAGDREDQSLQRPLSSGWAHLPRGFEDGGRPDPDRADPVFLMEGELKGIGRLKVWGSHAIIYLAVLIFSLLLSVPLWTVSTIGGPVVTGLITMIGFLVFWKKIR